MSRPFAIQSSGVSCKGQQITAVTLRLLQVQIQGRHGIIAIVGAKELQHFLATQIRLPLLASKKRHRAASGG